MNILSLIAEDRNVLLYRKEFNSVTASILLHQFIYWGEKNDYKSFYKFIEPCGNELYKDGDSWSEELGFSKREFQTAYKKLENLGVVSKKTNIQRVTFYTLNKEKVADLMEQVYSNKNKKNSVGVNVTLPKHSTENDEKIQRLYCTNFEEGLSYKEQVIDKLDNFKKENKAANSSKNLQPKILISMNE